MTDNLNLEHIRAVKAFNMVEDIENSCNDKEKKEYRSHVHATGFLIRQAGLMQTLAFYQSKGGMRKEIWRQLLDWLSRNEMTKRGLNADDLDATYRRMLEKSSMEHILYTQETEKLLIWLKRFAEAKFKDIGKVPEEGESSDAND